MRPDRDTKLYLVTMLSNPIRFASRYRLYRDFIKSVTEDGFTPITVEVAFGDRAFSVTERDNPSHLQLRTNHEIWHKENALNLGVEYLSQVYPDWQYVAFVDADVDFARRDIVPETIHQLQHHPVVQMFSKAHDLGPGEEVIQSHTGFAFCYRSNMELAEPYATPAWHPGFAWAFRREALDHLGGLLDTGILGSGDRYMALSMIGQAMFNEHPGMHPNYLRDVARWESRAEKYVRRNIGFVQGSLWHHWHGKKSSRGYRDRWKILNELQYDPDADLKRDAQGLYQLVDHGDLRSIQLRNRIQAYFRARNEDSIDTE